MTDRPRPVPRWWEFATDSRIFCGPPGVGHHIPNDFDFVEQGFVYCRHWIAASQRTCDQLVFVYRFRGGYSLTAAISRKEKEAMKHLGTPAAMIEYLGIFDDMRRLVG